MIKAIETVYKGYRFRSRLEARYAVFFDALGVKWDYEKEGYDLGNLGWYLPDFFLSNCAWVEIKPRGLKVDSVALDKCSALAFFTHQPVALICGNPWPDEHNIFLFTHDCQFSIEEDGDYCWGSRGRLMRRSIVKIDDELEQAYAAARSARFEHGEKPA